MCIQHKKLIINTIVLTKCRKWLLVMVCLFTLIPIKKIVSVRHNVIFVDRQKFSKWNIILLVERWMPCDLLWAFNSLGSNMQ
jgi:hypothetical protein